MMSINKGVFRLNRKALTEDEVTFRVCRSQIFPTAKITLGAGKVQRSNVGVVLHDAESILSERQA